MKILHVINSLDPSQGGTVASVRQVASLMKDRGHRVEIAALSDRERDPWLAGFGPIVHCFGPAWGKYAMARGFRPWLLKNAAQYNLVVINGLWQYQGIATASVLWQLRRPYVIFVHGMLGPFGKTQRWKYLKKFAYWTAIEQHVVRRANATIFTSAGEERLARRFFPFHRWRPVVIENCVDAPRRAGDDEKAALLSRFPALRGKRIVLFLGRLHPVKGCDDLIRAFAGAFAVDAEMHLVIAGPPVDAAHRAELVRLCDALRIAERVTWTGMVDGSLKRALLTTASVFVSPSHHENFGIAIVEALAGGIPVILTDKANIHEVLGPSGAALVCEDNAEGLARALREWRALSPQALAGLRDRQMALCESRFSRARVSSHLDALLSGFAPAEELVPCRAS